MTNLVIYKMLALCLQFQDQDYDGKWNRLWESKGAEVNYLVAERGEKYEGPRCIQFVGALECEKTAQGYHCLLPGN